MVETAPKKNLCLYRLQNRTQGLAPTQIKTYLPGRMGKVAIAPCVNRDNFNYLSLSVILRLQFKCVDVLAGLNTGDRLKRVVTLWLLSIQPKSPRSK